jgi:hypothetical protein
MVSWRSIFVGMGRQSAFSLRHDAYRLIVDGEITTQLQSCSRRATPCLRVILSMPILRREIHRENAK